MNEFLVRVGDGSGQGAHTNREQPRRDQTQLPETVENGIRLVPRALRN